jgi:formate dehydrogenase assembly factor FdhD
MAFSPRVVVRVIDLCGFVRGNEFNVYAHAERIGG